MQQPYNSTLDHHASILRLRMQTFLADSLLAIIDQYLIATCMKLINRVINQRQARFSWLDAFEMKVGLRGSHIGGIMLHFDLVWLNRVPRIVWVLETLWDKL